MLATATHCLLRYGYQLTKPILANITVQPHWKSDNFQKSLAFTILIFFSSAISSQKAGTQQKHRCVCPKRNRSLLITEKPSVLFSLCGFHHHHSASIPPSSVPPSSPLCCFCWLSTGAHQSTPSPHTCTHTLSNVFLPVKHATEAKLLFLRIYNPKGSSSKKKQLKELFIKPEGSQWLTSGWTLLPALAHSVQSRIISRKEVRFCWVTSNNTGFPPILGGNRQTFTTTHV